jgi:hypothetical protein
MSRFGELDAATIFMLMRSASLAGETPLLSAAGLVMSGRCRCAGLALRTHPELGRCCGWHGPRTRREPRTPHFERQLPAVASKQASCQCHALHAEVLTLPLDRVRVFVARPVSRADDEVERFD